MSSLQTEQNNQNFMDTQQTQNNNEENQSADFFDPENIKENLNNIAGGITEKIDSGLKYIKLLGPVFVPNILLKLFVILCFLLGVGAENHWQACGFFWFGLSSLINFWFVKKIAFRRQVCINYSCKTDTNGDHLWTFEKMKTQQPTKSSKYCFWIVECIFIVVLCIFDIASLIMLSFGWVFIVTIATFAFSLNAYLMNKCDNDFEIALKQEAFDILQNKVIPMVSASIPENNNNDNNENLNQENPLQTV